MVSKAPGIWGYLYQQSEKKPYEKQEILKSFDRLNYQRHLRTLRELNPDAVLRIYFLPYISVSDSLRAHGITAPVIAVTTDFDIHQLWVDSIVE
jgi:UDP-N-acetylglucosamine:LPS N-acetylglucosamine transferase